MADFQSFGSPAIFNENVTLYKDVEVGGNMNISGNFIASSITESSSITLKENINPLINTLDKILQLNPVTYDRKNSLNKNEVGLIAEEVNKVIPNLVSKDSEGKMQGINYTRLSVYLIDAVKTLAKEIEELKNGRT